jgi:hypothetical protein
VLNLVVSTHTVQLYGRDLAVYNKVLEVTGENYRLILVWIDTTDTVSLLLFGAS